MEYSVGQNDRPLEKSCILGSQPRDTCSEKYSCQGDTNTSILSTVFLELTLLSPSPVFLYYCPICLFILSAPRFPLSSFLLLNPRPTAPSWQYQLPPLLIFPHFSRLLLSFQPQSLCCCLQFLDFNKTWILLSLHYRMYIYPKL